MGVTRSQSFEHRKFKYQWNDEIKVSLKQDTVYKNQDAVILFEETTIDVEVQNIKRYQIYQFNTQQSIQKYNMFRVPVSMEPSMDEICNVYKHDTISFPKLLYEKINFFDARIIRNGEFVKAILQELAFRSEELYGDKVLPYYVHYFYVRNLEPGDQLEVITSHHWPAWTSAYYLNSTLPKQEIILTVNNDYLGKVYLNENNQLARLVDAEVSTGEKAFKFTFTDVKPVYKHASTFLKELPHVEFYYDKTAQRSYKIFAEDVVDTLTWSKYLYQWVKRIDPNEPRSWETYDDQTYLTSQFFRKVKSMAPDTTDPFSIAEFMHNYTADQLKFKHDYYFIIHEEPGFVDMGKYLKNGILRETARYQYYYHLFDRLNIEYFLVPFQDRRIAHVDVDRFHPLHMGNVGYGIILPDQSVMLFHPKTARFGWYTNELPFYFHNEFTFMIPQTVPRKIYDKDPDQILYPIIKVSPSRKTENQKEVSGDWNINLEKGYCEVENDLALSGQFSTLTRGYYLYGWKDTTISPTYYADIFANYANIKVNSTVTKSEKKFPFRHIFKLTSDSLPNIFSTIDGYKIVNLSGLLNIHYEELDSSRQWADYQPDFCGIENYTIDLWFDKLVEIADLEKFQLKIVEDEFELHSAITKMSDNGYQLTVRWEINADRIPAKKIGSLSEAYRYLKFLSKLKLKVKPV